jgi:catechol 2,3-dioxygenase-like lactoylglutathione lyase family enzyme
MTIHLHHVHMNAADRSVSEAFYAKHLAAEKVRLNDDADALHIAPILFLIDEVGRAPRGDLPSALQHVGFGSVDPAAWYESAHAQGVDPDTRGYTMFTTNETPTIGAPGSGMMTLDLLGATRPACFPVPDALSYIYVLGPDQERVEVWSGAEERVNHVHFTTPDLAATVSWYQSFLGVPVTNAGPFAAFYLDDVLFFYEPVGAPADYAPTDDHVLGHVAFSVTELTPWLERAKAQSIDIVAEPAPSAGFTSFFVRGPDGLLIEMVQAAPSPELCPEPP